MWARVRIEQEVNGSLQSPYCVFWAMANSIRRGGGESLDCLQQTVCPFPPHRYITECKHETGDFRWFRVRGHRLNFMQASLVADGRHPMGS